MNKLECIFNLEEIAKAAGSLILEHRKHIQILEEKKMDDDCPIGLHPNKLVLTQADLNCQKFILEKLIDKKYNGLYGVCGEESSPEIKLLNEKFSHANELIDGKYTFIIDPIDGTKNYIDKTGKNGKKYGVYINLAYGKEVVGGVIYFPEFNLMFKVIKDNGMYLNNKRVFIDTTKKFDITKDLVRISASFNKEIQNKFRNESDGSMCYTIKRLANSELMAYAFQKIDLVDFGCVELMYKESGGFFGNEKSEETCLADLLINENGTLRVKGPALVAPSKEYHKSMMEILNCNY